METSQMNLSCWRLPVSKQLRRSTLALGVAAALSLAAGAAQAASETAQAIADHFSNVRTMAGEFVQFGPSGEQTGGKFYIQRPGKIRFIYENPSGFQVTSDGKSVVILNKKMETADLYPLSKTPLKLLLDDHIDLSGQKVKSVKQGDDVTTIKLADRSLFGNSTISMMFDPESYDLRQWTITDAQGKDTTVMIYNVQKDVKIDPSTFEINYNRVSEMNANANHR
jgi:outer membrane lipoprotein-sorting protein